MQPFLFVKQIESQGDCMFKINDVIVYENGGVCQIRDIGVPDFIKTGQVYYKLQPINTTGNIIYVKLENKHMLRYTISKKQAEQYVGSLPELEGLYNKNNKFREKEYAEILKTGDYKQYLEIYKGIEQEKSKRSLIGKSLNTTDDRNLKKIVKLICTEFSIAMEISEEEVRQKMVTACF